MAPVASADLQALMDRIAQLEAKLDSQGTNIPIVDPKVVARHEKFAAERERRMVLANMLNTNLLAPGTREQFEAEYAAIGKMLEEAAAKDAS